MTYIFSLQLGRSSSGRSLSRSRYTDKEHGDDIEEQEDGLFAVRQVHRACSSSHPRTGRDPGGLMRSAWSLLGILGSLIQPDD
jgi:hypothetical protein